MCKQDYFRMVRGGVTVVVEIGQASISYASSIWQVEDRGIVDFRIKVAVSVIAGTRHIGRSVRGGFDIYWFEKRGRKGREGYQMYQKEESKQNVPFIIV